MGVIRIFLALSVVVWHVWGNALPFTVNGYIAVFLFFIISGFYMSMVLNERYSNSSILKFYAARLLRIYPLYLIALVTTVLFWNIIGKPLPVPPTTRELLLVTLANITTIGIPWVSDWNWVANPPAWSLGLELQFYLVAPFILTRRLWVCVLVLLGLIAWRLSLRDQDINWLYTAAQADACFFMLGAVAHRLGLFVTDRRTREALGWVALAVLPVAGLLCGLPFVKKLDRPELWVFYLVFASAIPFVFSISKLSRVDRLLGDLSYPIYVVHWLMIGALAQFGPTFYRYLHYGISQEIDLTIVVLAAITLHFVVERPIEKIRQRFSAPSKPIAPVSAMASDEGLRVATPAE